MSNFYGELVIRVVSDTKQAEAGLDRVAAKTTAVGAAANKAGRFTAARMEHVGRQMQNVGRQMTQFVTLPIVAGFAIAGVAAFKYQDQLMKIQNLTGTTAAQTKAWGDELIRLGGATGQTPIKLAESLYFVASSGFKGAEAMKVIEVSAKAAAAGMGDVMVTADVLTSAMNSYGHSTYTAAEVTDYLMKTVEVGKAEPVALANSLGRIMPVAAQLKVGLDELGGNIAALTLGGLSSAEAVTALRGTMMSLVAPAKMSIDQLKEMGFSYKEVTDSIAKKGLLPTLKKLWDATGHDMLAMRKIIPNVRALNGVLSLLGANYENNLKVIDKVGNAHGALDRAMKNTAQQPVQKLRQAWASLQGSFIKIGAVLLPFFAQVAAWLAKVADSFTKLSPGWRTFIMWAAAAAAAVGPLIMVLGSLINALGLIGGVMAGMRSVQTLGAIFSAFKVGGATASMATFAASLGPVAIGLGALAAAAAVVWGATKLKDWLDGTTARIGAMRTAAQAMKSDNSIKEWTDRNFGGHLEAMGKNDFKFTVPETVDANTDLLANWVKTSQAKALVAQKTGQATMRAQASKGMVSYYQQEIHEAEAARRDLARVGGGGNPYIKRQLAEYDAYIASMKGKLAGATGIWRDQQQKLKDMAPHMQAIVFKARMEDVKTKMSEVKKDLAALKGKPHTIKMMLREEALREKLRALKAGLNNIAGKSYQVRLHVRIDTLERNLALAKRRLQRITGGGGEHPQFSAKVSADISKLETFISRGQKKVDSLKQKTKPAISVDDLPAINAVGNIQRAIDSMHGKTISIVVKKTPAGDGGHSGGIFSGPHSGYPMTLHGKEVVLPLDHPALIPNIMRRAGLTPEGKRSRRLVPSVQQPIMRAAPPQPAAGGVTEVHHHYNSSVSLPGGVIVDQPQKLADRLSPYQAANMRTTARRRQRGQATL